MFLLARTSARDQVKKKTDGLSVFLVDMREAVGHGLTIRPIRTMINHATTEVFFDNLSVPAENLIGEEGKGFRYILEGMNAERILIGAECVGDARWFIAKASAYAKERRVFDRPIARTRASSSLSRAPTWPPRPQRSWSIAPRSSTNGTSPAARKPTWPSSWHRKRHGSRRHVPADARGFGFAEEYDVERKFRETRLYQIAPISTNLVLSYIAEHVLGLPRSY